MSQLHANYKPSYPILITQNMLQYLFYANFAANFLLYNASGRTFRNAMMRCGRRCVRRLTTCRCVCRRSSDVDGPPTASNRAIHLPNLPLRRLAHAARREND